MPQMSKENAHEFCICVYYMAQNIFLHGLCIICHFSRYDPNVDIPTDTDSEQDRVIFIKSVAQFMVR